MDELTVNSIKNTRIPLSRNTPAALVVGAATFLGSHLVDRLLEKNIQVIGIDDLRVGKKQNLALAIGNKNFHNLFESADNLTLEIDRLDYLIITPDADINLKKILQLFKEKKCRLLLISSVKLYEDKDLDGYLKNLKKTESEIAKFAGEHNLNARILRLGAVFGPRMDFETEDPLVRLIQQSLSGDLQKEINLEFSTRALFITDSIDAVIKCILAGSTAQRIFDGVSPDPVKVSEVKQVLLDPVWYQTKEFVPTELPPWPTPNLEKTMRLLNWHPQTAHRLVENLRLTLSYFKDNEIRVPQIEEKTEVKKEDSDWKAEKGKELQALKGEGKIEEGSSRGVKTNIPIAAILIAGIIMYALIWPILELSWGILTFRYQLLNAVESLEKGEFDKSLSSIAQAKGGVIQAKTIFYSLDPIRKTGVLPAQFEIGDNLANLATQSLDSAQDTIFGIQSLYRALKSVTGELDSSPKEYLDLAQTYLSSADEDISKAQALMSNEDFKKNLPVVLKGRVESLSERLSLYSNLVKKSRALAVLLPEIVALEGSKNYLVILQNNNELRPTGGFIGSFAKINFEGGRLKKLEVNDVYAIDGQLKIHVEPPKEIKEDLNQKDYFLRDANWEPDFPTSARQIEWFYNQETGERVEGVIALDVSAIEDLLSVVGSLDLPDYNEKITSENLFEKAISYSEVGFFPGTQAKKSFLTALTQSLFNKLFFLPNQNWPGIVSSLGRSLEGKHLSLYLDDPKLFSYLASQNWAGVLPRAGEEETEGVSDFLFPVEANLGANKSNYYLDRSYNLETVIGKDGEINHRLRISYTNRSPSDTFPAGKYKNRMRIYLPFGTKINRVLWGESDITKNTTSFVDYGRSGYSILLELLPKQQKVLVVDYQIPQKLEFKEGKTLYRLDVVKQQGTLKDPFVWRITYPINMRLTQTQAKKIGPQEQTISTDLSQDRSFEVEFTK